MPVTTTSVPRRQGSEKKRNAKKNKGGVRKANKAKKQQKDGSKAPVPLSERRAKLEEMKQKFAKDEKRQKRMAEKLKAGKSTTRGRAQEVTAWRKFHKHYIERRRSIIAFDNVSPAAQAVYELNLNQQDLRHLKNTFELVDLDGSGEIDYDEFFDMIQDTRSPFTDALFALIDEDGSGAIDFGEFVHVLSTYCMYTRDDILKFAFDTFDKDGSGAIDEEEYCEVMKGLNSSNPVFPGNFQRALEEFDQNDDGLIDFNEFKSLARQYPILFFPAFRLQDRMQQATLGAAWWVKAHEYVSKKQFYDSYTENHGGNAPPLTCMQRVRMFCGGEHPWADCMKVSWHELQQQTVDAESEQTALAAAAGT